MMFPRIVASALALTLLSLSAHGCGPEAAQQARTPPPAKKGAAKTMKLTSSAFAHGAPIPVTYTEEGEDLSPPLAWSGAPEKTRSFALMCEDPDAPSPQRPAADPWIHWVLFHLPSGTTELPQGIRQEKEPAQERGMSREAQQGCNAAWGMECRSCRATGQWDRRD